jgi:hypothetical protein
MPQISLLHTVAGLLVLSLASAGFGDILLNEINFNPPGPDGDEEYIELFSTTGGDEPTDGLTIVIIDGNGGKSERSNGRYASTV